MTIDPRIVDYLKNLWRQSIEDLTWKKTTAERVEKRKATRQEILQLLQNYNADSISAEEFRSIFDRKTRTDWNSFGIKGPSGAMVLNQIIKEVANIDEVSSMLKSCLVAPSSEVDANNKITKFLDFLRVQANGRIAEGHTPFFLSIWWHMQSPDTWPIYYPSSRKYFVKQNIFQPTDSLADGYIQFRRIFNDLASSLEVEFWWLELFFAKLDEDSKITPPPIPLPPPPVTTDIDVVMSIDTVADATQHIQVQWLIAKLGQKFGFNIHIARNDQSRSWNGNRLSSLSISSLPPLGLGLSSERTLQLIDVVWLKGNQIQAAFEIECTTSIYSGLLRMSDLCVASPNLNFYLYIVAPKERSEKVKAELSRPTFQQLELQKRCGIIELEVFIAQFNDIHKWADNPVAIEKLASWVPDVSL